MEDSSAQQGHLSIKDLNTVFKELYDVRWKWENFGLELKIKDPDLKAINETCRGDSDKCFKELLSMWLRLDPEPTRAKLACALKSRTVGYGDLSEMIMPEYVSSHNTHSKTVTLDFSSSCQSHLPLQVVTAQSEKFRCPCGKCDLMSYMEKPCPKSNSHPYPYLPLDHLSDDDKEDLIQKLSDDTANIIKHFAVLLMNTCESLKTRQVTIAQLTNAALSLGAYKSQSNPLPLLKSDEVKLRGSTSIDDAFNVLRNHVSFFNYEILGHIIECLGAPEDKEKFESFCSKFKEFCQRKLFEVSPRAFSSSGDQLQRRFVILATEDMFEKLIDVKNAQRRIASILGLRSSTLQLKQIDISSVILVFSIPMKISDIFPLEQDTIKELEGSGYTLIIPSTPGSTAYQPLDMQFQPLRSPIPMDVCQQRELLVESPVIHATTLNTSSCSSTTVYDAKSKSEEFDRRFSKLLHKTKLELTAKKNKSAMFNRARTRMRTLPYSVKRDHYRYVRETVSCQDKGSVNLDEFFSYVDMYSHNCFEYKLLEEVVENSNCSPALCNEMHLYAKDIQGFQQRTKSLLLVHQNVGTEMEFIPPYFEHMTTFHPQGCTLEDLYAFRKEACLLMEIPEYAILNNSLTPGSIRVMWMFPVELRNDIIPFLCGKIGQRLLQTHSIETLLIADQVLHHNIHSTGYASDAPESVGTKVVKLQDLPEDHSCKLLLSVIKQGDSASEKVKSLLKVKDDEVIINCTDENGCTPLFIATTLGSLETVKLLIRNKANITITDKNGKTNLMAAVESANTELVQMYLDDIQVDVNIQEKEFGWSALHFAAKIGSIEIVKLLIRPESDAHITVKAHDGKTPVDVATESGHKEIAQLLTSEINFETDDDEEEGKEDKQGRQTDTDEKEHVEQGNVEGGVDVLKHGSGDTRVYRKYRPILPWRRSKLTKAARNGLTDEVRRLLENGHDPNTVKGDISKWTPLMYASHQGYTEIVRLLLKYGAKRDLQSSGEGWTALILASYRGFIEVVKLLISYGVRCEVNKQTNRRRITALQRVCLYSPVRYVFMRYAPSERRGEVVKLLLDNGADVTLVDNVIVRHILERIKKDFPDEKDRRKILDHEMDGTWTALMEASEEGHTEIVKMLLEAGATANKTKKDRDSALHVAAYHGHDDIVQLLSQQMNKEDINAKNNDGMTPLMLAMKRKQVLVQQKLKVIDQLMEHGADLDVQTDGDKTVMSYAQKSGSKDVLERIKYWANVTRNITDSVRRQVT